MIQEYEDKHNGAIGVGIGTADYNYNNNFTNVGSNTDMNYNTRNNSLLNNISVN